MPLLELRNLTAAYGSRRVLHGLDLSVDAGEIVALLGANGAGKTTTLRAVSGTVSRQGAIVFEGRSLLGRGPADAARLGIAHVPEGRGTMGSFTVMENLQMGAYLRRDRGVRADLDRIFGYFPDLAKRRRQRAAALSGGEQQMLAIGRALMARPRLLLLDEPSLGLAPLVVERIFSIVSAVNRELSMAVLLVEQNAVAALELSHRGYVLEAGTVAAAGASSELEQNDAVRRSYLGY